jgi:hypothetical protein
MDHACLAEVPLKSGRRADILSLTQTGSIWIVEVKSGVPDFRSDHKWQDYLEWCDCFCFAVGPDFPVTLLPEECGLIISDHHGGVLVREPRGFPLAGARRRSVTLRFAHLAAGRLASGSDPLRGCG